MWHPWFHWKYILFCVLSIHSQELCPTHPILPLFIAELQLMCITEGHWDSSFSSANETFLGVLCPPSVTCRNWLWMSLRDCFTILSVTTSLWKTSRTSSWLRRATWIVQSPMWTLTVRFYFTHCSDIFKALLRHSNMLICFVNLSTASPTQQEKHTCVRKSLICAFAIAFIISVMLIAANQMLRRGMK